ncbi:DUF934 domain-containing protein [Planktotalea sp.]|uniref:DUF934 domain-containing protein n=1 Tax=Planktotalea sp. TaxID=2029877 RepID=UPI003D6AE77E
MSTLITDTGFTLDDFNAPFDGITALDLASDVDPTTLDLPESTTMIRVDFPSFADGRGFTIARQLRLRGYTGRLRARGHVIADQYAMARRAGFDEVEIDAALAQRQPEADWLARADWQNNDYQARLRG